MNSRTVALGVGIAAFAALTAQALMHGGLSGIIRPHFQSWGGAQVFSDLVILAFLSCLWIRADARKRGMRAWPYILLTILAASFGPLIYLLMRELRAQGEGEVVAPPARIAGARS